LREMILKVALVDDHPVFRAGLRAILSAQPDISVVGEAGDAAEAYSMVAAFHPHLVLLDVALPGPSGIMVARELLRRDPSQRLLMLSMRDEEETVAEALAVGARGYACKDQTVSELLAAVRTVAGGGSYLSPRISADAIGERLSQRHARNGPLGVLSDREREVFELLVRGFTNDSIALNLTISKRTVETHRSRVLKKLRVHSAVELLRLAARHGLLG
jgi:DNA-binding NarL/FixJ family response regulator